jgi:transposase
VFVRRQAWFDAQPEFDPEHLVFIDETGASTKMARLRGRARRGQRCRSPVPHGHWKTTTFTAALRLSGMTAPMLLYLPPYSPDFNPLENAFSKLKAILRKAATRSITDLWDAIGNAIDQFTPTECANYFTAAGYEPE